MRKVGGRGGGGGGLRWIIFEPHESFPYKIFTYIYFWPAPPPTHNFSKCPSLMTQTVNNDRLH